MLTVQTEMDSSAHGGAPGCVGHRVHVGIRAGVGGNLGGNVFVSRFTFFAIKIKPGKKKFLKRSFTVDNGLFPRGRNYSGSMREGVGTKDRRAAWAPSPLSPPACRLDPMFDRGLRTDYSDLHFF